MNILFVELKKLLSKQTICLAGALLLFQLVLTLFNLWKVLPLETLAGEVSYIEYHTILKGPLTDEKEKYIHDEYKKVTIVIEERNDVIAAYEQGLIDSKTFFSHTDFYFNALAKENAIQRIFNLYEYLKDTDYLFIYDTGWLLFLQDGYFNWLIPISLGMLLIPFFTIEWRSNMLLMLRSSKKGIHGILYHKIVVGVIFSILFTICVLAIDTTILRFYLPLTDGSIAIRSIPIFLHAPEGWSLSQYAFMQSINNLIGSIVFTVITGSFSIRIPQALSLTTFFGCLVMLPMLLYYRFDLYFFSFFPSFLFVNGAMWNNKGVTSEFNVVLILLITIILVYISILSVRWHKHKSA